MTNFPEWLLGEIEKRGWTQAELARRAEVTPAQISRVLSQAQQPGPDTCTGIARALKINPEKVFRRAGLLPPAPEETATITEFVYALSQLPPDEQEKLLLIAQSWIDAREREKQRGTQPRTSEAGA